MFTSMFTLQGNKKPLQMRISIGRGHQPQDNLRRVIFITRKLFYLCDANASIFFRAQIDMGYKTHRSILPVWVP
ncbi:MAG: hypothetical protein ABFD58_01590, partial [Anaerolineaceae bacterium]